MLEHIEQDIKAAETELEDDAESIIINERYNYVTEVCDACYKKKNAGRPSASDRIDSILTHKWIGLPVFVLIMFCVYFIAMAPGAPGTALTDWANNKLFDKGWYVLNIGESDYENAEISYLKARSIVKAFIGSDNASEEEIKAYIASADRDIRVKYKTDIESAGGFSYEMDVYADYEDLVNAANALEETEYHYPERSDYGLWIPGIPTVASEALEKINCAKWLEGLIVNGIIAGVGAVIGFLPQMFVLFLMLSFLEACGYMSRIAFVLDRIFRKFGLSGKSFIPILVGTGCGVPGIMASRTIENERDRRMTVITTTFIPCSAKLPIISMIAGAVFGGSPLIAVSAYFIGIAAIVISGIMLKKQKMFAAKDTPFVMELPEYHFPSLSNVLSAAWDRAWSFVKKAGTIILLSTVIVWFLVHFGFSGGAFKMLSESEMDDSMLAVVGKSIAWIFAPLGWGKWQAAVAMITGIAAKENIVSTMSVFYSGAGMSFYEAFAASFTGLSSFSFLIFNLLCVPCVSAIAAIRREMNSGKWTLFAIAYQSCFAYAVSLMINQFGLAVSGNINLPGFIFAAAVLFVMVYTIFIKKDKSLK